MNYEDEITKIFCEVDDFCKEFSSRIIELKRGQLSGNRFVELQQRVFVVFALFLKTKPGRCTGISFIDSTTLKVCRNQRIHSHKVFRGLAERGKSSMGWFYGFKLHPVCNERGELLSFYLTRGNVDDRNPKHIKVLCESLFGKMFADRHIMSLSDKILLRKRAIIETINDELKNLCRIEHSRHRSVNNFTINILGALTAYCFFPKKPSLNIKKSSDSQLSPAAA